ncbi:hypothetical protein [Parasitella parasitica]|uniref:F-box domain-containing protein n=1 Tax=Parasitella parasitica TaxID=35722 RepID=A0A0B7NK11_9FUNG|nr:hypothetical protein [Parasitella parasitica]
MIATARKSLTSVNLSQCYCLSTFAIKPLLTMPSHQLVSLVLYGCGNMDSQVMADIIFRHSNILKCLRLTEINDTIIDAIKACKKLNDLGLEHCSDTALSKSALTRFFTDLSKNQVQLTHIRLRDIDSLSCQHLRTIAESNMKTSLVHLDMSECNRIKAPGISWLATGCTNLQTLLLAYQAGVTNQAIQLFIGNCHQLKHMDISGCRLLTDHAFFPLLETLSDNLMEISLETLNVSGLDLLSGSMVHQLLTRIDSLKELCLGVTYDLNAAELILQALNVNDDQTRFYIDTERFYTISKLSLTNRVPCVNRGRCLVAAQQEDVTILPSSSTWGLPLL